MVPFFIILLFISAFAAVSVYLKAKRKKTYESALELFNSGSCQQAMEIFKNLQDKEPRNKLYGWYIAQCYEYMGNLEMALVEYNRVALGTVFKPPLHENDIHFKIGMVNLKLGNLKKAFNEFSTVVSLDPQYADAYFYLGMISKKRNQLQKAMDYLDKAVHNKREYPQAYLELGIIAYKLNHLSKARKALLQALSQNPEVSEAHYYYGLVLEKEKSFQKSIEEFNLSVSDDRFKFDSYLHLGDIYREMGQDQKARDCFEKALEFGTDNTQALLEAKYKYANYLVQFGEINKALSLWREINTMSPHYKDVETKINIYSEISKSENLTRFITCSKKEFLEIVKKLCRFMDVLVEDYSFGEENFVELKGSFRLGREDIPCIVHAARWTTTVGEIPVRELLERMTESGANKGIFIVTSDFSEKAQVLSTTRPLDLVNRQGLENMLTRVYQ
ncbi:MAG: tetratricopeptide repeat protein [Spirochaetota bacterium]